MIELIEQFYEACPALDFRFEGMGFGQSALILVALVFAFGREAIWAAIREKHK